jgi:hypothetical protein
LWSTSAPFGAARKFAEVEGANGRLLTEFLIDFCEKTGSILWRLYDDLPGSRFATGG